MLAQKRSHTGWFSSLLLTDFSCHTTHLCQPRDLLDSEARRALTESLFAMIPQGNLVRLQHISYQRKVPQL
ncbi:hypothetical protein DL98DRAFT_521786 [Cadophora sp. DSE1049]|nr:hypothetical protein DL98DRAFT_521786 [Cadophora sp. DSE1049]